MKTSILSTLAVVVLISLSLNAEAGEWGGRHPRRAQVNSRLNNQNRRIKKEVREGELSPDQAARLHRDDRQIRGEEKAMASQNGGHITKLEQKTLNQQENRVSKKIGN